MRQATYQGIIYFNSLHPDQARLPLGSIRFILSLWATGEGHISSITFHTGNKSAQHRVTLTPSVPFVVEPKPIHTLVYEKVMCLM